MTCLIHSMKNRKQEGYAQSKRHLVRGCPSWLVVYLCVAFLPLCLGKYLYIYFTACTFYLQICLNSHLLVGLVQASISSLFVSILPMSVHMILCVKRGPTGANKGFCTCLVHDGNMCPQSRCISINPVTLRTRSWFVKC
jgi:hypothetical protein